MTSISACCSYLDAMICSLLGHAVKIDRVCGQYWLKLVSMNMVSHRLNKGHGAN